MQQARSYQGILKLNLVPAQYEHRTVADAHLQYHWNKSNIALKNRCTVNIVKPKPYNLAKIQYLLVELKDVSSPEFFFSLSLLF